MYSVLILTYNEEVNLPGCLASIAPGVDVHVLDSESSDSTVDIARQHGAAVHLRRFDNYAAQRNHGLAQLPFVNEWVLMLDADERLTAELHAEIVSALGAAGSGVCLFRMRRKDMLLGRWLRRSSGYPTWFGRLARRGRVSVQREINEEFITDGEVRHLTQHLVHYPFNKGMSYWFERHNRYSSMEASSLAAETRHSMNWRGLFHADATVRRRWLKQLAYRLPMRPTLVFVYLFLVRGGVLDGRAGRIYCSLRFVYECMIDVKLAELRRERPTPTTQARAQ